jgi:hypothetical protein
LNIESWVWVPVGKSNLCGFMKPWRGKKVVREGEIVGGEKYKLGEKQGIDRRGGREGWWRRRRRMMLEEEE